MWHFMILPTLQWFEGTAASGGSPTEINRFDWVSEYGLRPRRYAARG